MLVVYFRSSSQLPMRLGRLPAISHSCKVNCKLLFKAVTASGEVLTKLFRWGVAAMLEVRSALQQRLLWVSSSGGVSGGRSFAQATRSSR